MAQAPDAFVVDASVAAKWQLPEATEEHADHALALLAQLRADAISLIAPRHIRFEVPSSLTVAATAVIGPPIYTPPGTLSFSCSSVMFSEDSRSLVPNRTMLR